jgi:hypothetical protein
MVHQKGRSQEDPTLDLPASRGWATTNGICLGASALQGAYRGEHRLLILDKAVKRHALDNRLNLDEAIQDIDQIV